MEQVLSPPQVYEESGELKLIYSAINENKGEQTYLLFIGKNSIPFCSKLVYHNFTGISFTSFQKAFQWMMNQVIENKQLPFAILCDDEIENEDIYKQIQQIKNNNYLNSIPLILISGSSVVKHTKRAVEAKVDDYYPNTVEIPDLVHRLKFLNQKPKYSQNGNKKKETEGIGNFELWLLKRPFDIFFSSLAILLLSPILLIIGALIKLDSKGPIIYVSQRAGSGYKIFQFYKFRTMKTGADKDLNNLLHLNQYNNGSTDSLFLKLQDDPRITKLGAFLRNTSLDELPQLFNVLKGDMSIVGNRPLPLYEASKLTKDQWAQRFLAPAGITGLWQVTKRGKAEMSEEERIQLDMDYATKSSFLFDLSLIIKTFPALLQKEKV